MHREVLLLWKGPPLKYGQARAPRSAPGVPAASARQACQSARPAPVTRTWRSCDNWERSKRVLHCVCHPRKKAVRGNSGDNERTVCLSAAVTISLVAARPVMLLALLQWLTLVEGLQG